MKKWGVAALIVFWLGWHLAVPIQLTGADLGRHIKNGELILQGHWDVLYKNYYSYTCPQYPFVNHHWLFGVISFIVGKSFGFAGLSLGYLALEFLTFLIFFLLAVRYSSFILACAFGLLSFPLLTMRPEIRPEGFSMLFCGLFWWLIDRFLQNKLRQEFLMIWLCLIQIIWVNTHIFFVMGPVLALIFGIHSQINGQKEQAKVLFKTTGLLLGMCLVNPSGSAGALEPLRLHQAFTYFITEALPVSYWLKEIPENPTPRYFLATLVAVGAALVFCFKKDGFKKHFFSGVLIMFLSLSTMKAVRIITPYGFFWIPLTAYAWFSWMKDWPAGIKHNVQMCLLIAGILVSAFVGYDLGQRPSIGIIPGVLHAAEFFKGEHLRGPIFNNYDLGGYLIYALAPQEKLFVDDRPEAFPEDFFRRVYVPMQMDEKLWQAMDQKYHFNVIIFSAEVTPWGEPFIRRRNMDPYWALVYMDEKIVILLKRNAKNEKTIRRYEKYMTIAPVQKLYGYIN